MHIPEVIVVVGAALSEVARRLGRAFVGIEYEEQGKGAPHFRERRMLVVHPVFSGGQA
jgi:hypothetical protein